MKRIFLCSLLLVAVSLAANAFSYEAAREEAYFLTDKMAYELNLTSEQYNRVYQVNLDYFLSVSAGRDRMAVYRDYRDADLRYILADWQYSLYRTLAYFCSPLVWRPAGWHFVIYDRYRRGYLYFGRPAVFVSYRGQPWIRRAPHEASPYRYVSRGNGRGMRDYYFDDRGRRPEPGMGGPAHSDRHGGPAATRPDRTPQPGGNRSEARPGNANPPTGATARPSAGRGAGVTSGRTVSARGASAAPGASSRSAGSRPSAGRGR